MSCQAQNSQRRRASFGTSTALKTASRRRQSNLVVVAVVVVVTVVVVAQTVIGAPAAIGVRRLTQPHYHKTKLSIPKRELKYIFVDENRHSVASQETSSRSRRPPSSSPSSTTTSSSLLHDIVSAFQQAVSPKEEKDANVHVGKLLTAMSKMETHMRQVGMTQAANDIKNNHDKVFRLYMSAPKDKRDSVRSLLEWELEAGVHGESVPTDGPIRVKNNSGAMGLFWIGHTVKYQYDLYRLITEEQMNPVDAATVAFQNDLEPHLPWAASKMAKAMIPRATPSTQLEFFKALGGYEGDSYGHEEYAGITQDVKSIVGVWGDMLDDWSSPFADLNLRDI